MFVFFNIFKVFVLACKTLYNLVPPSWCLNPVTFYVVLLLPSGSISVADAELHRGMCLAAGWEEKGCVWRICPPQSDGGGGITLRSGGPHLQKGSSDPSSVGWSVWE